MREWKKGLAGEGKRGLAKGWEERENSRVKHASVFIILRAKMCHYKSGLCLERMRKSALFYKYFTCLFLLLGETLQHRH